MLKINLYLPFGFVYRHICLYCQQFIGKVHQLMYLEFKLDLYNVLEEYLLIYKKRNMKIKVILLISKKRSVQIKLILLISKKRNVQIKFILLISKKRKVQIKLIALNLMCKLRTATVNHKQ